MAKKEDAKTVENSLAFRKYLRFLPNQGGTEVMGAQESILRTEKNVSFEVENVRRENCNVTRSLTRDILLSSAYCNSDFKFHMINSDRERRLSPYVTSLDKNPEKVVFPSVRSLIRQFSKVECEESSDDPTGAQIPDNGALESCDSGDLVKDSSSYYTDMSEQSKCLVRVAAVPINQRTNSCSEQSISTCMSPEVLETEVDVSNIDQARTSAGGGRFCHLSVIRDNGLKWRSFSDSNLGRRERPKGFIISRLDSGTSDLSDEGGSPVRNSSRDSLNEGKSGGSLSPACSSTGSVENVSFNVSRPLSCDLCWSSFSKWDRSNSSDSAVIVEDEGVGSCSSSPYGKDFTSQFKDQGEMSPAVQETHCCEHNISKDLERSANQNVESVVFRKPKLSYNSAKRPSNPPSVVISDYSGGNVSVHVAYASDDFSLNSMLRFSAPDVLQGDGYICDRKVSDCSTCSSVSTVDMGPGSLNSLDLSLPSGNSLLRRTSDCSSCCLTGSEDEVEVNLRQPSPPPLKKTSHWRKVRNVVQWTPFIQTYKRHKYPWVQLAGHQGNFKAGHRQGTIMKKLCPAEEKAFEAIAKDALQPFVPDYLGVVEGSDGENYLQLQDLLTDFSSACVMDIKMGVRTYLEEELAKARIKPKLRKDMYEKMVQIDAKAPTEAEHKAKAVTKPRYMVWRETISSTATLGFRIEGVRRGDGSSSKDFKTTRTREQVIKAIAGFVDGYRQTVIQYIQRLKVIRAALEKSTFFKSHELIGSSLLFVHNEEKSGIWLIDFAKTIPLPDSVKVSHNVPWIEGTHEDGYLIGLDNLIELLECILENPSLLPSNKLKSATDPPEEKLPSEDRLGADVSCAQNTESVQIQNSENNDKISNSIGKNSGNILQVNVTKDKINVHNDTRAKHLKATKETNCHIGIASNNVTKTIKNERLQKTNINVE